MPDWVEVSVEVSGEAAEIVAEVFERYGHQGVVIEQAGFFIETWEDAVPPPERVVVKAYFLADASAPDKQAALRDALRYLNMAIPVPEPAFRALASADWETAWRAQYKPLRVGRRLYIHPTWITPDPPAEADIHIALDPGMAFGTGTHPSTQLCLLAAEELLGAQPGWDVLDLGCGSGILSIAAAKLGAARILALDTDEIAVRVTAENAEANGVAGAITAQTGSLASLTGAARRFDLALVNILAKVIIAMCDEGLGTIVRPGGVGVFGGIMHDQAADVRAALERTGLTPYHARTSGDWVVIQARRPH
ncbi:MAG: 50S ribosomal protein L11 methyltransferase [Anaerolineales bacterium]